MTMRSDAMRHAAAGSFHGLAVALLLGLALTSAALTLGLVWAADQPGNETGELLAIFPFGMSEPETFGAVVRSGGSVQRAMLTTSVLRVVGREPGFAARLRRHGALLILPPPTLSLLELAGCSYLPQPRYRPLLLNKLRSGPL